MTNPSPTSALERLRLLDQRGGNEPTPGPQRPAPSGARKAAGAGGVLLLVLGKAKFLLGGLKLLSFGKLLTTLSTMGLSLILYMQIYGFWFAAGFLFLILVHELGHGFAAKLLGLNVGAPVFIPFFGAYIALKDRPRSTYEDFLIGAGGPLAGSAGGLLFIGISRLLDPHAAGLFYAVGAFTLHLNLFNLFPVWQLDGARMMAPITRSWLWLGFLVLVLALLLGTGHHHSPQVTPMILIALVAFRAISATFRPKPATATALGRLEALQVEARTPGEVSVSERDRSVAAITYFGLAATLVYLVHALPVR